MLISNLWTAKEKKIERKVRREVRRERGEGDRKEGEGEGMQPVIVSYVLLSWHWR